MEEFLVWPPMRHVHERVAEGPSDRLDLAQQESSESLGGVSLISRLFQQRFIIIFHYCTYCQGDKRPAFHADGSRRQWAGLPASRSGYIDG